MHSVATEDGENLPATQTVHVEAPVLAPVFVTEPAAHTTQSLASSEPVVSTYVPTAQSSQADTLDKVEYLPTAQVVHLIAPVLLPLSVTEPALQLLQLTPASNG